MKLTKAQLKQLIKEELEVTLTNEEAGEMFGEEVQAQLEEQEEPLNEKPSSLAKRQQSNLRAYTNADPKEKAAISDLETALLTVARGKTLQSLPDVVRAIKLLQRGLEKANK